MTDATSHAASPARQPHDPDLMLSQLGADVIELVRRAAASEVLFDLGKGAETSPSVVLRRMVLGRALTGDEGLLGFPVAGSRLVHVTVPAADADRLSSALEADRAHAVTRVAPDELVLLVRDVPRAAGDDRGLREARRLAARVHRLVAGAAVGISDPIARVEEARDAAEDAADGGRLARALQLPTVECGDWWASLTLARVRRRVGDSLSRVPPIERLRAYDRRHGSDLAGTVATWLRNNQDTRRTAEQLAIHVNTLRYRLRRVTELAGLDLDDPEQRMVIQIALG